MIDFSVFDRRPVVALASPNGAGKTTFYHAHLAAAGLRFINADVLATELAVGPYEAARLADALRREMLNLGGGQGICPTESSHSCAFSATTRGQTPRWDGI
jgi:predicted ABC-type ATPase